MRRAEEQQSVAVGGRVRGAFSGDIATGSQPVLYDKLLAKLLRQPLAYCTRHNISGAAGGEAHKDAHRARRIGLRPRHARHSRQRGSPRAHTQKFPAGKFHLALQALLRNSRLDAPLSGGS